MTPKIKTLPDLSLTSPLHMEALKDKDTNYKSWQFNVIDKYKDLTLEEIKTDLNKTKFPFSICFEHLINDFNVATGIRNANCFNAKEVFYIGNKKMDRRGALGTYKYIDVTWLPTVEDFLKLSDQYTLVGIDNVEGAVPIDTYQYPHNPMFIFGEEGVGLTPAMQSMCKDIVYIPQYGSCRSLNVGTASGIVMHDFVSKYNLKK